MDQSQDLLVSLKKLSDWVDFQKKISKWSLLAVIPFVAVLIGAPLYLQHTIKEATTTESEPTDWYDVTRAERTGDLEKALMLADELLIRTPLNFEGHYRKGELLLQLGKRDAALESFRKAESIFPIPKHKEAVAALEN